jgi:hypothetical protein
MNPALDLTMVSDREGTTEQGIRVPAGTTVEYRAHVSSGMVRVRFEDGHEDVMHPACFEQLRDTVLGQRAQKEPMMTTLDQLDQIPAARVRPTIGRSVHYYKGQAPGGLAGPYAATIIELLDEHTGQVMLAVFPSPSGSGIEPGPIELYAVAAKWSAEPTADHWCWPPRVTP